MNHTEIINPDIGKFMLKLSEIPNEVIDEISSYYKIDWNNYGDLVTQSVTSKQVKYELIDHSVSGTAIGCDPCTFEKFMVDFVGVKYRFLVRAVWCDGAVPTAKIFSVIRGNPMHISVTNKRSLDAS